MIYLRGIRGAITCDDTSKTSILSATKLCLETIISRNEVVIDDIASIFFSATPDLNQVFPAQAARDMGLTNTPLLCLNEMTVPGSLTQCVRILMHVNTPRDQASINHVYLGGAKQLRPDQAVS